MNAKSEVLTTEYIRGIFNIYKLKLIYISRLFENCSVGGAFELIKAILGRPKVTIAFRNGKKIMINRAEIFTRLWFYLDKITIDGRLEQIEKALDLKIYKENEKNLIEFTYLNKDIRFSYNDEDDLLTILMALESTFVQKKWNEVECKDNVIIDVGGNVGDTALFFYMNGARKVITIEPSSVLFEILSNAIVYQKTDAIVCVKNSFEGFVEGYQFEANYDSIYPYFGSYFGINQPISQRNFTKNEVLSLDDLLGSDSVHDNLVLKLSCAGCEYYLLKLSTTYLRQFKQIVIEFNYGYKSLCEKLERAGFLVTHSKPLGTFGRSLKEHNVFLGMIIAKRKDQQ